MQPYQSLCIKKHPQKSIQESINIQSIPSFKNGDLLISIQDFNFRCPQKLTSFQDKLSFCFNYIINFLPFVHFVYCVPYVPTDLCVSKNLQNQKANHKYILKQIKNYLMTVMNWLNHIYYLF